MHFFHLKKYLRESASSAGIILYLCDQNKRIMNIKITAIRKADYRDLQAQFENPIEHACDVQEGQTWISVDGAQPEGMCDSAWESMRWFVQELAAGRGNFYDGWMKDPHSAMISCNDGFRPVSFYIELAVGG